MTRAIRFRAYDKELKKKYNVTALYDDLTCRVQDDARNFPLLHNRCNIMQFTGLLDKHGKEIYEADIVVQDCYPFFSSDGKPNYIGVVEWVYSQWQVILRCVNKDKASTWAGMNQGINDNGMEEEAISDWEVIGNIYENEDLLNDK